MWSLFTIYLHLSRWRHNLSYRLRERRLEGNWTYTQCGNQRVVERIMLVQRHTCNNWQLLQLPRVWQRGATIAQMQTQRTSGKTSVVLQETTPSCNGFIKCLGESGSLHEFNWMWNVCCTASYVILAINAFISHLSSKHVSRFAKSWSSLEVKQFKTTCLLTTRELIAFGIYNGKLETNSLELTIKWSKGHTSSLL